MFKISDAELKRFYGAAYVYTQAEMIIERDMIEKMTVSKTLSGYLVEAQISDGHVEIRLNEEMRIIGQQAWGIYWSTEAHILSVMLLLNDMEPESIPYQYLSPGFEYRMEQKRLEEERVRLAEERRLSARSVEMLNQYRDAVDHEILDAVSGGEVRLTGLLEEGTDGVWIRLKIGKTTDYVVKDIRKLVFDIAQERFVSYGKNLAFRHSVAQFDPASREIIHFLQQLVAGYDFNYHYGTTKEMLVQSEMIDQLYDVFLQTGPGYRKFELSEEETSLRLEIAQEEGFYRLAIRGGENYFSGKKHLYRFHPSWKSRSEKQLGRLKLDELGKGAALLGEMERDGFMLIPEAEMPDFYRFILSDLKAFMAVDYGEFILSEEEGIALYGDIDEWERVVFKIDYTYADGIRKGFDPENKNLSIKARKIESYLKTYAEVDSGEHAAYMDLDRKGMQELVRTGLPYLQNYCEVYISESLKQIGNKAAINLNMGVTVSNNLLAIDLDSVDIPRDELAAVLGAYKRKKKFYRLKNGERLYLEAESLEEMSALLDRYGVDASAIEEGRLELDLYRAFSVEEFANRENAFINIDRSDLFKEIIDNFSNVKNARHKLAPAWKKILRDYQKYGYQWLQTMKDYGFGGILADDMGLGKTLQVITLLTENKAKGKNSLVIAPASLILNWQDEIQKFSPKLKSIVVYGPAGSRRERLTESGKYDVIITSYDYIRRDIDQYGDKKFHYIVLDEAQYIKNPKTKGALAVKKLKGEHRLALTGTPIENSLAELWSIFDFLMPGYLYNYAQFQRQFETPIVKDKNEERQQELKKLISPFILRRTKKEVLKELPDKIEKTLPIKFNSTEKKLYLANLMQANKELQEKMEWDGGSKIAIFAMLTRLRQICCEPRVLFDNISDPSSKITTCIELIKNLRENNKKILLFSTFTSVLDLLAEELDKELISHYLLTGSTDKDKRRQLVQQFQEDKTAVFLISLKAGGTGLNLTAAEAVIHFDPWWNISAQNQATDRAHRIGQENVVQVFKLIMKDSIEEKILQLQEQKKGLSDTFVEGNAGTITNMSTQDLVELFSS